MSIEHDFTDHDKVLRLIEEVQDAEKEQRYLVREQKIFCLEKDGQWDDRTVKILADNSRYRGTFDQVSPILEQITGEMDAMQYGIKVHPAGGDATEETAETYAGLIRNIENISNATLLYSDVGQSMVMGGIDGLEVVQDYLDADTFDQDLIIKPVSDWYKSVWFDLAAVKSDMSDANWCIKLRKMPAADYDKQFPKGSGTSIGDQSVEQDEHRKTYDTVTVGKIYYKKPVKIPLVKLSNGQVMVKDEKFDKIKDELAAQGVTVTDERERNSWRVWTRILDGGDWLGEEEKTAFSHLPLVPAHGNFAVLDGVRKYFGKTLKLMDSQRGLNFAMSAEVEDVALSPPQYVMMTREQGEGEDYSNMNIDRNAVRFHEYVQNHYPPMQMGGKQANPGMQVTIQNFQGLLAKTANMDDPSMGQNPGLQSGAALNTLVTQSNNGNVKWHKSMETLVTQLSLVIVDASPRVYDGARQQRIMGEDGTGEFVPLNQTIFDQQTQQNVEVNDLSKGSYDVTRSMGDAFKNQQQATVDALIQYASIDPELMNMGRDIIYKNQDTPGMDTLSERFRMLGIQNGTIPREQYTDEEEAQAQQAEQQAAQNPQPEDPMMIAAQAEMGKAQAEQQNAQNKTQEIQGNQQLKGQELQLSFQELQLKNKQFEREKSDKYNVDAANIQLKAQQQQLAEQKQRFEQMMAQLNHQQEKINDLFANRKTAAETAEIGRVDIDSDSSI